MGNPHQVEDLGETQITEDLFQDYLRTQGGDRFRGDRYDLFHHNCNNFSNETAQFLVGKGIPRHIVDLPGEILATPMGQMLAPMLQQMTPSGTSIPFTDNPGAPSVLQSATASSTTVKGDAASSSSVRFPVRDYITFDQQLKIDGLTKKLEEFNNNQTETSKLSDSEIKIVIGIAKGLVRMSDDNFAVLLKITKWKSSEIFPLLDILRFKSLKNMFDNKQQVEQVVKIFENNLTIDSAVNAMLSVRGLVNMIQKPDWRSLMTEEIINKMLSLLPCGHNNLEIAISSYLYNVSVLQLQEKNLDTCILVASSLVLQVREFNFYRNKIIETLIQVLPVLTQDESIYRSLVCLGNILHTGQEEVSQFLLSLEAKEVVSKVKNKEARIADCASAILKLLAGSSTTSGGLDLD